MKPSFTTVILFASIVLFSILVANVANLVNTESQKGGDAKHTGPVNAQYERWLKDKRGAADVTHMDDTPNHLMVFIQVSVSLSMTRQLRISRILTCHFHVILQFEKPFPNEIDVFVDTFYF